MDAIDPSELLVVGRILRAHGIAGELKILPETDSLESLREIETLFVGEAPGKARPFRVEDMRIHPGSRGVVLITRLEGINSKEEADALSKKLVFALGRDLPPLEEGEFFLDDVVGLSVVTEEGEEVGVVREVVEMPAHPVFVVDRPGAGSVMVPAVSEFIRSVNTEKGQLVVRPIEGLFE